MGRRPGDPAPRDDEEDTFIGLNNFDLDSCAHLHRSIAYALPEGRAVTLLLLEPHFDVEREEWFVDLPLNAMRSADPFIWFVLVRYQEHMVSGILKTSGTAETWAKLLPDRTLDIQCEEKGEDLVIDIAVSGPSHGGPLMPKRLDKPEIVRPRMRIQLCASAR